VSLQLRLIALAETPSAAREGDAREDQELARPNDSPAARQTCSPSCRQRRSVCLLHGPLSPPEATHAAMSSLQAWRHCVVEAPWAGGLKSSRPSRITRVARHAVTTVPRPIIHPLACALWPPEVNVFAAVRSERPVQGPCPGRSLRLVFEGN